MIGRALFILTILSNCVLSLPVISSQLENDDVQVMKCIVEALADVLSKPHPNPVSQECLVTLRTDDRLVSILRHHNFLKELQEIAMKGGQERAQLQREAGTPDSSTQSPQTAINIVDQSMLEALGGPGERSILSQKRTTGRKGREEEKDVSHADGESQEDNNTAEEVQLKREDDESLGSHVSEIEDEWSEGKAEKREEEEEESNLNSEGKSEARHMAKEKKGSKSSERRDTHRNKSKEKKSDEDEKEKRSMFFSHKQEQKEDGEEEEEETKRGGLENVRKWNKRGHVLSLKRKAVKKDLQELTSQQEEVPHHSKEVSEEAEKKKRNQQRSPEEKELRMIARGRPGERRGSEEEGSASRRSEEPEIESLAAIESELENVAQKLHELRRG